MQNDIADDAPVDRRAWLLSQLRRPNEMCRYYNFGWCKRGNSCRYSHSLEELPGKNRFKVSAPVLQAQPDTSRFSDRSHFKPGYMPRKYCKALLLGQSCRMGNSCFFAHHVDELHPDEPRILNLPGHSQPQGDWDNSMFAASERYRPIPPRDGFPGRISALPGTEIDSSSKVGRFLAGQQPGKICVFALRGSAACPEGDKCLFAHTLDELDVEVCCGKVITRFDMGRVRTLRAHAAMVAAAVSKMSLPALQSRSSSSRSSSLSSSSSSSSRICTSEDPTETDASHIDRGVKREREAAGESTSDAEPGKCEVETQGLAADIKRPKLKAELAKEEAADEEVADEENEEQRLVTSFDKKLAHLKETSDLPPPPPADPRQRPRRAPPRPKASQATPSGASLTCPAAVVAWPPPAKVVPFAPAAFASGVAVAKPACPTLTPRTAPPKASPAATLPVAAASGTAKTPEPPPAPCAVQTAPTPASPSRPAQQPEPQRLQPKPPSMPPTDAQREALLETAEAKPLARQPEPQRLQPKPPSVPPTHAQRVALSETAQAEPAAQTTDEADAAQYRLRISSASHASHGLTQDANAPAPELDLEDIQSPSEFTPVLEPKAWSPIPPVDAEDIKSPSEFAPGLEPKARPPAPPDDARDKVRTQEIPGRALQQKEILVADLSAPQAAMEEAAVGEPLSPSI